MHLLTLKTRVDLGPKDSVEPGDYLVEDVNGAQLIVLAGGGDMREVEWPIFPADFTPSSVLFIRAGGFGDLVLMTPVLREHKARFPNCKIGVATMPHYAPVLENLPFIDEIVAYPVPVAVADQYEKWIPFENSIEQNPRAKEVHMTELFGEIAGVNSITDLKPAYTVRIHEGVTALARHPRKAGLRRVCIQVGASAVCRTYPHPLLGQAVGTLLRRGWEVFLLGSPGEATLPDKKHENLHNLTADGISFRESCAVLNTSDAFIGCDSALLHVAGALGVPAVGLYGPFPWKLRTAHCPTTVALTGAGFACAPCFHHMNTARQNHFPPQCPTAKDRHCGVLAAIKPERIVAKVEEIGRRTA